MAIHPPVDHSPAILVRRIRWSETSLIVVWLTRDFGTLRTVARGALRPKNPLAGKLDLFLQAEISFAPSTQSDLHPLRDVATTKPFDPAHSGYPELCLAAYFAELATLTTPPNHPAPTTFNLLTRAINHLQNHPASPRALAHFEKELARSLGVLDPTGQTPPLTAIASLTGHIPASRPRLKGSVL